MRPHAHLFLRYSSSTVPSLSLAVKPTFPSIQESNPLSLAFQTASSPLDHSYWYPYFQSHNSYDNLGGPAQDPVGAIDHTTAPERRAAADITPSHTDADPDPDDRMQQ